jgi:hypothetical protein
MSISVVDDVVYKVKKFMIFGDNESTDVSFKLRSYLRLESVTPTEGNVKTRIMNRKYLKDFAKNIYRYYASDEEISISSTEFLYNSSKNGSVMYLTQSEFGTYCKNYLWDEYIENRTIDNNLLQVTEAYNFYISSIAYECVSRQISELLKNITTVVIKYTPPENFPDDIFSKMWINMKIPIAKQKVSTSIIDWVNGMNAKSIYLSYLDGGEIGDYLERFKFSIDERSQHNANQLALNKANYEKSLNIILLKKILSDFHSKFAKYINKNMKYVPLGDFMNTEHDDNSYDITEENIKQELGKKYNDFVVERSNFNASGTPCSHFVSTTLLKKAKSSELASIVSSIKKYVSGEYIYGFIKCNECHSSLICPHMLERLTIESKMGSRNSTENEQSVKNMLKKYVTTNGTKNTCNICGAMFGDLTDDTESTPDDNEVRKKVWELCAFSLNSVSMIVFVNRKMFINTMFLIVLSYAKQRRSSTKVSDEKIKAFANKNLQLYIYTVIYAYTYIYKILVIPGGATFKNMKVATDDNVAKLCIDMISNELNVNTIEDDYIKKEIKQIKVEYSNMSEIKPNEMIFIDYINEITSINLYSYAAKMLYIYRGITDEEEIFKTIMGVSTKTMYLESKELLNMELFKIFSNTVGITQLDWNNIKSDKRITINQHFMQLSGMGRMYEVYNAVRNAYNSGDIDACKHLVNPRKFRDPSSILYKSNQRFVDQKESTLNISYDENGIPHNWDIYVFEGGEVKGSKNIYNARMDNPQLGKLIDHKCTVCNIEYSKCNALNTETIQIKLNDISIMDSLFVYYLTVCPEGDLHNGNPCKNCGHNTDFKDDKYFQKYIAKYLESTSIIIEYKKPEPFIVQEVNVLLDFDICLSVAQMLNVDIQLITNIGSYEFRHLNKLTSNIQIEPTSLIVMSAWNAYRNIYIECMRFLNGIEYGEYTHTGDRMFIDSVDSVFELMKLSNSPNSKCHRFIIESICSLLKNFIQSNSDLNEDKKYTNVAKMILEGSIAKQKLLCITLIETEINSEDLIDYDIDIDDEIDEAVDENEIPETD